MLDNLVTGYHKLKYSAMDSVSGVGKLLYEEARFYDLGYMQTLVKRLKMELKATDQNLQSLSEADSNSYEDIDYRNQLLRQREALVFQMIFAMSNSFSNIDICKKLSSNYSFEFMNCVDALYEYNKGNEDKAFELLNSYCQKYKEIENHFLINKVYGILLYKRQQYERAIQYLSCALNFVPDDEEALKTLSDCYKNANNSKAYVIILNIINLLEN